MLKKNGGFTFIEAMISVALMSIICIGVYKMYSDGNRMWNYGTAKIALAAESRIAMTAMTKFVQECQGSTLRISRLNGSCPANSYISGQLGETVYVTGTQKKCGCRDTSDWVTFGSKDDPSLNHVEIFQYYDPAKQKSWLLAVQPRLPGGVDLTDPAAVRNAVTHQCMTISANVDMVTFAFTDSEKGRSIDIGIKLSKKVFKKDPPITTFLKKTVVIKRFHSAGYYGN